MEPLIGTSSVKSEVLSWSAINFQPLIFHTGHIIAIDIFFYCVFEDKIDISGILWFSLISFTVWGVEFVSY